MQAPPRFEVVAIPRFSFTWFVLKSYELRKRCGYPSFWPCKLGHEDGRHMHATLISGKVTFNESMYSFASAYENLPTFAW